MPATGTCLLWAVGGDLQGLGVSARYLASDPEGRNWVARVPICDSDQGWDQGSR